MDDDLDFLEASRMFSSEKNKVTPEEQLALFMHRFNLDIETIESMPAFEDHCKELFSKEKCGDIKK